MMYRYRILEDPTYIDKATEHEKEVANTIQSIIDTGVVPEGFEIEIGHCIAEAFTGMKIGEEFYQPMIQVIDYLQDNGFAVYICSGSDRLVVRGIVEGGLILAYGF